MLLYDRSVGNDAYTQNYVMADGGLLSMEINDVNAWVSVQSARESDDTHETLNLDL